MLRHFRPAFVQHVEGMWVAVDDLQPVAVALDAAGVVRDVVSWRDLPAPREIAWPWRQVQALDSTLWVHDRPAGPTVRIDVSAAGGLSVAPGRSPEKVAGMSVAYSRFSRSGALSADDGSGWRFVSSLAEFRWTAEVHRGPTETWPLGPGSIISWSTAGAHAAVCVRRADKRPWAFRPSHDLLLVGDPGDPVTALPDGLDVTDLCWPRPRPDHVADLLIDYLPFIVGQCRTVQQSGGLDVGFAVRDLNGLPRVETTFRLDPSGPRFVHVDEPVDELGRLAGLRFLNISLDEDINGSPLYNVAAEIDDPVYR